MQLQRFATAGETSPELHNTRGVECTTGDGVDDLQPDPLDVRIKLKGNRASIRMPALEQKRPKVQHIRRVTSAHQLLGTDT